MQHETLDNMTFDDLSVVAKRHLSNITHMLNGLSPRQMSEVLLQLEEIEEQISYTF